MDKLLLLQSNQLPRIFLGKQRKELQLEDHDPRSVSGRVCHKVKDRDLARNTKHQNSYDFVVFAIKFKFSHKFLFSVKKVSCA